MMRSAMVGAVAVLSGCSPATPEQTASKAATATPPPQPAAGTLALADSLDVVKQAKGPVMTTIDEFYKIGPRPSSSHTIGPMRITYDFYQRCTKLPPDQLAKATALQVHLKKPVLSVNETQGHVEVMGVLSTKRRHAHVITHHRNRRRESAEGQCACRLRQRTSQQQPKCAARKDSKQHEQQEQASEPDHPLPRSWTVVGVRADELT